MMDYNNFCSIMNKHIFKDRKKELLRITAEKEFYIGRFSLVKRDDILNECLQYLIQSNEMRMGNALEEIIENIIQGFKFENLPKNISDDNDEILSLDQYFTNGKTYYFIEQKVRDDHDSSKKRGQISNFEKKLEILYKKHGADLIGIMYFIDPDLSKNKNYYTQELKRLGEFYGIRLYLFYGKELFEYFKHPEIWDSVLSWLKEWKNSLPELPDINLDKTPQESFDELKDLELRVWRKIIENEKLWEEGILKAIFREGTTLKILVSFFKSKQSVPYENLSISLTERLNKYYANNK